MAQNDGDDQLDRHYLIGRIELIDVIKFFIFCNKHTLTYQLD